MYVQWITLEGDGPWTLRHEAFDQPPAGSTASGVRPDTIAKGLAEWQPAPDPKRAARIVRLAPADFWRPNPAMHAEGKVAVERLRA